MIFGIPESKPNPAITISSRWPPEISIVMMIYHLRSMAFVALAVIVFAAPYCLAEPTPTLNDELLIIDNELSQAKNRLSETVVQMRKAKQNATEKRIDLETQQSLFAQQPNPFHEGQVSHAKQRVALAEMRIDSIAAKFERIQRRMEDLAAARVRLLESHDNRALAKASGQTPITQPEPEPSEITAPETETATGQSALQAVRIQAAVASDNEIDTPSQMPVLSVQGKLTDPITVEDELQKLERHLITADAPEKVAQHVKVFGSTIAGEIALSELGANQYFAHFTATQPRTQLVVGARFEQYVRATIELAFTDAEIGQEFILIFDANHIEEPRMIVFQSTLLTDKKAFAAYQQF